MRRATQEQNARHKVLITENDSDNQLLLCTEHRLSPDIDLADNVVHLQTKMTDFCKCNKCQIKLNQTKTFPFLYFG